MSMEKNLYDQVLSGVFEVIEGVSDSIAKEFKKTNPFDKEPVSDADALYEYDNIRKDPNRINELLNQVGDEVVSKYFQEMENLRRKK